MGARHHAADVTQHLVAWSQGDRAAADRVIPLVYNELRRLAASQLRKERSGHTLQPTALVHEAFLRLVGQHSVDWRSRGQFFAIAARSMRQVLVDYARQRGARKRGGGITCVSLSEVAQDADLPGQDAARSSDAFHEMLHVDAALTELATVDPELERLVELRYFGGLTVAEAASALGVSPATAKRGWATARAWLFDRLSGNPG